MASWSCLRRTSGLLILVGSSVALVLPAAAATVNGTLTLTPELGRRVSEQEEKQAGKVKRYFWKVPNGAVATRDPQVNPAKDLAVILEPAEGQSAAPAGQTKVIDLRGGALVPSVVVVTPHTKVRFRNTDAFVYELQCSENPQMSQAQVLPPLQQVDYPFDEEGTYRITDKRLPHLVGWVVVVGTAFARNPEAGQQKGQAAFSFENVSPGRYVAKVFHGGEWVASTEFEVGEEAEEVGVQLNVPSDGQQHEQEAGEGEGEDQPEQPTEQTGQQPEKQPGQASPAPPAPPAPAEQVEQ